MNRIGEIRALLDQLEASLNPAPASSIPPPGLSSPGWPAPVEMWCNEYPQDDAPAYMRQFPTRTQANICRARETSKLSRWILLPNRLPRFVWTATGDTNIGIDPSTVYHTEDDCMRFMQSVNAKIHRWVEVPK